MEGIERGIPVPKGRYREGDSLASTARKMKVGDSVLFENINRARGLYNAVRYTGYKAVLRLDMQNKGDPVNKWRVWKAESYENKSS